MRDLVRSWQRVTVETPWGELPVDPPSVRVALSVLCCAEEAAKGRPEAIAVLEAALRSWLPLKLSSLLASRAYPPADAVRWAVRAVEASAPELETLVGEEHGKAEISAEEADSKTSWQEIDWAGRIADYSAAYGCSPEDVLEVPFGRFLVFMQKVSRVHARDQLRQLKVRGLPYADEVDRRQALERLAEEAGYPKGDSSTGGFDGLTEEEAIEKQKEILARMNRRLGRKPAE